MIYRNFSKLSAEPIDEFDNYQKIIEFLSEGEKMGSYKEKENSITKFLNKMKNSLKVIFRNYSCSWLQFKKIENLYLQQIFAIWRRLVQDKPLFTELKDFIFLENDIILDQPYNYEIFKREFFKLYFEKADKKKESQSQKNILVNIYTLS